MSAADQKPKKKDARQEAMERAAEEERLILASKMEDSGLNFVDHGLPPDEVDQDDVAKSLWSSIRGLFPGTDEYYEAEAAEEEMDNLKAIRIEKAKAEDYLALTKVGKHEEALAIMMAETNNDFFFFNKLMTKMEAEGKWEFEEPELNPFGILAAQQRRNRIRRAFRVAHNLLNEKEQLEMQATLNAMGGGKKKDRVLNCPWKGKSKQGEYLKCNNLKMEHPNTKEMDPDTKKEIPLLLEFCCYHSKICIEEHEGEIQIKVPNQAAMCTECHMMKRKDQPLQSKMTWETCPGVGPATSKSAPSVEELEAKLDDDNQLTPDSVCDWVASKKEISKRGFTCSNCVIRNPESKALHSVCGWHMKKCLRLHTGGGDNSVTIPNQHGLCVMHHTAEYGEPPKEPDYPYPGMIVKKGKNAWMTAGHHWASPKYAPFHEREAEEYEEPDEPADFVQQMIAAGKYQKFLLRKRREGKQCATVIQSVFRRWKVHNSHYEIARKEKIEYRLECVILMQCTARRRAGWNQVNSLRIRRNKAALLTQKHYRGFVCRKLVRQGRAARRIQKVFKKLNFFKFRDLVILTVQLRKMSRKRNAIAVNIQRVWRGCKARLDIFQMKLYRWICQRAARRITEEIRAYNIRKEVIIEFIYPNMDWARERCGKRLAKLIHNLWITKKERVKFMNKLEKVTLLTQRHVRAFIVRKGVEKMRYLKMEMRKWIEPKHAVEFITRFFESNVFYLKDKAKKITRPPTPPPEPTWLLRPFLREDVAKDIEVSDMDFSNCLVDWYKNAMVPLLQSEIDALRATFSNPATGKIEVAKVEDYMMLHKGPCRKHGRHICGTCYYRGDCASKGCRCQHYYPSTHSMTSICKDCFHTPDFHRKKPLQIKEMEQPRTMLSLMRAQRDADTGKPATVQGIDYDDIIVPPEDPDDVQLRREVIAEEKDKKETMALSAYRASTLNLMLMFLEEKGEDIAHIKEYWGQNESEVVGNLTHDEFGNKKNQDKAIVDVPIYDVVPYTNLDVESFWANATKNPNKSTRDYDEKFEHNMPMPIVHNNEITYTFEGSKVYLNILIRIIDIGEDKIPGAAVHYDNPDFMRLVVDHIQIFERHWRKMVADLREGKLNRNTSVDKDARAMFEALSLPRIALSKTLDEAFRNLGFHKKVLGKDITTKSFAERIRWAKSEPRDRRPSLPMTVDNTGLDGRDIDLRGILRNRGPMSRGGEYNPPASATAVTSTSISPPPSRGRPGYTLGSHSGGPYDGGSRQASSEGRRPSENMGSPPSSRNGRHLNLKNKDRRELLVMVGDSMKLAPMELKTEHDEIRSRGPSRRSRGDGRRGSDTDILRDASDRELNSTHIEQETDPRTGYHFTIEMDSGGRFICPFPACGKNFKSKDAAFRHLPVHEQRTRLFAPTALPDSHLHFYWPAAPPWEKEKQFTEIKQPTGNIVCSEEGCGKSFANQDKLNNHIRLEHGKIEIATIESGWFKTCGEALCVPPFKPPKAVAFAVDYCVNHLQPNGTCVKCVQMELQGGPKPPYRFYEGVSIDLKGKEEASKIRYADIPEKRKKKDKKSKMMERTRTKSPNTNKRLDTADSGMGMIKLLNNDFEQCIIYRKIDGVSTTSHLGYICSVLMDKTNAFFVGVRPLFNYTGCLENQIEVCRDYDKASELMSLPDEEDDDFEWVPINTIMNVHKVYYTSKENFRRQLKRNEIPKNSYFIRTEEED